jgi:excisionase family DNA binding protein
VNCQNLDDELLDMQDALKGLGNVSRSLFYKLVASGRIRTVKVGRLRKTPRSEIARITREGASLTR